MAELVAFPEGRAAEPAAGPAGQGLTLGGLLRPAAAEGRGFAGRAVTRDTLEELHALMALGPGMAEASPTRVLFLASEAAKARLAANLAPAERAAAADAPACAVVGYDRDFAEQLVEFMPGGPRLGGASCFDRPGAAAETARRNGVLQGAYLAVAARSLGLEAAFVTRFDRTGVAAEFFRGGAITPIFVARLGYPLHPLRDGDPQEV
jgi:3-hydroxypropanoate dehydrogenase